MNVSEGLFYTKEHEWARLEGNKAYIGITDYAQESLGDITFLELPKVNSQLEQFKIFSSVESVKAASDVYAPLSGKVVEVNNALESQPELLNKSCYMDGWIAVLEVKDEKEKSNLMDAESYRKYLKEIKH